MKNSMNHQMKDQCLSLLKSRPFRNTNTEINNRLNMLVIKSRFLIVCEWAADVYLSVSFFVNVFQFFTKPKPPKGYYIYGDVGKRCIEKKNNTSSISDIFVTGLLLSSVDTLVFFF